MSGASRKAAGDQHRESVVDLAGHAKAEGALAVTRTLAGLQPLDRLVTATPFLLPPDSESQKPYLGNSTLLNEMISGLISRAVSPPTLNERP